MTVVSPIDFAAVQKALVDWVVLATGMARASVRYRDQKALEPLAEYCEICIDGVYSESDVDEVRETAVSGGGVELEYYGVRTLLVFVDFFSSAKSPNNGTRALATAAQSGLRRLDVIDALFAGGVRSMETGRIYCRSEVKGDVWEHAAKIDIQFGVRSSIKEIVADIAHVIISSDDLDVPETVIEEDP